MRRILPLFALLFGVGLTSCQAQAPLALRASGLRAAAAQPGTTSRSVRFYDSAKDAFRWAEFDARDWDFAARLAKVEGSMIDESGKCFEWRFYFTAPGKQKALRVSSNHQKQEVPNTFFGGMLDISWHVDSGEAIKKAKEQGLKSFPVSSMELDSFLVWDIRSYDGFYRVDAR
ncbi:MAG: hypothetical protein ACAI44_04965 [Candidatus Sericytochromatia bacterium]